MFEVKEFELPDDTFLHLKEEQVKCSSHTYSSRVCCEVVEDSCSSVKLKCTATIHCPSPAGKVQWGVGGEGSPMIVVFICRCVRVVVGS